MKVYILIWPALFAVAFINGAIRELTYGKYLCEYQKHAAGTAAGTVLIGISIYIVNTVWPFHGREQAFYVGLIWTAMTVIAETVMVLFFMKKDFKSLLRSYDITKGELWPLFLVFLILFPPFIAGKGS
jgi:hypothetical protein